MNKSEPIRRSEGRRDSYPVLKE